VGYQLAGELRLAYDDLRLTPRRLIPGTVTSDSVNKIVRAYSKCWGLRLGADALRERSHECPRLPSRMTADLAAFLKTGVLLQHVLMMLFCERSLLIAPTSAKSGPILLFLNRKRKRSGSGSTRGHKPIESSQVDALREGIWRMPKRSEAKPFFSSGGREKTNACNLISKHSSPLKPALNCCL
jgi:hypothetical protein